MWAGSDQDWLMLVMFRTNLAKCWSELAGVDKLFDPNRPIVVEFCPMLVECGLHRRSNLRRIDDRWDRRNSSSTFLRTQRIFARTAGIQEVRTDLLGPGEADNDG